MERWVPLFNIFINSPTPETDASGWLQESFNAVSAAPITTASFLSLLKEPRSAIVSDSSSCSLMEPETRRIIFMETFPAAVQSRILSFLAFEYQRFSARDLMELAQAILSSDGRTDFWVERAACHLFDVLSHSNGCRIPSFILDSNEERRRVEFESVPRWLKDMPSGKGMIFPWLPVPTEELKPRGSVGSFDNDVDGDFVDMRSGVEEDFMNETDGHAQVIGTNTAVDEPLDPEIQAIVEDLRICILSFESTNRTLVLANKICELCLGKGDKSLAILSGIEPWKADDENTSILISNITDRIKDDELSWPSKVLSSFVLPKVLFLESPASRVLLTSVIEFCKLHQRAAEYGLVFPLILRKEGINNHISDVISRVIRECLHPAHVTAICQKLFCSRQDERRFLCLPCHRCFISDELVWTESTFALLQNILDHKVHLTQDCIDGVMSQIQKLSERFSRSLKFGKFLLCLVTKFSSSLVSHKLALTSAVECTDTLMTKAVLSKLSSL
ncbi:hypothetical protein SAY86_002963 [Trapa natans]|uniref:Fanconi Anaemia group E protein C-terminal domain-containing protein n=1 Tax=Trapa natans TaxID=22666 RepID=A0AAN7R015_TRANT|nr:hypothetical protein SAY86_002963 [Trapa natans]